jgi:hypothetical protein
MGFADLVSFGADLRFADRIEPTAATPTCVMPIC